MDSDWSERVDSFSVTVALTIVVTVSIVTAHLQERKRIMLRKVMEGVSGVRVGFMVPDHFRRGVYTPRLCVYKWDIKIFFYKKA